MYSNFAVFVSVLSLILVAGSAKAESFDLAHIEFFEREVRPLLVQHCYKCHDNSSDPKGGLDLTSRASIIKGGDSGPAVVPGKPEESLLVKAVSYESSLQMPPSDKLDQGDQDRLSKWVTLGLPWPDERDKTSHLKAKNREATPIKKDATGKIWSFEPVRPTPPPTVQNESWPRTAIDRFILAELERAGLPPTAPADKRSLIRRATFDLTGLPPTEEEIDAFIADKSTEAFAKVVDRLLAKSAYGERWGRHWLDVVRYADSRDARYLLDPNQYNVPFGGSSPDLAEAWRYRDWVVNAINRDLPYGEFITRQIAGDLLPPTQADPLNTDGLVATGFLAIGEWGGGDANREKMQTDIVDDQVNTVCRAFLGLTIGCARCHDHKFDPISTADYYSLAGIFFSTQIATPQISAPMLRIPLVPKNEIDKFNAYSAEIAKKQRAIEQFTDEQYDQLITNSIPRTGDYLLAIWDLRNQPIGVAPRTIGELAGERGLREDALSQWLEYLQARPPATSGKGSESDGGSLLEGWFLDSGSDSEAISNRIAAEQAAKRVQQALDKVAREGPVHIEAQVVPGSPAHLYHELISKSGPFRVAKRDHEKLLPADALAALKRMNEDLAESKKSAPPPLPLALGARDGGVPNTSYAGFHDARIHIRGRYDQLGAIVPRGFPKALAGEHQPSINAGSGRSELAKWIASPNNPLTARVMVNRVWLHHFGAGLMRTPGDFGKQGAAPTHPALLDFLADYFLQSNGSLKSLHRLIMNSAVYQQSSRPTPKTLQTDPDNRLVSRMNLRRLDAEEIRDTLLDISGKLDRTMGGPSIRDLASSRRTIYLTTVRSDKSGLRFLFDAAEPESVVDHRRTSTVAPQALFLLNNDYVLGFVAVLAARVCEEDASDDLRIRRLYRLLFGRAPTEDESSLGLRFVTQSSSDAMNQSAARPNTLAWEAYCQALLCTNEFVYLD